MDEDTARELAYFRHREEVERQLAERAPSPAIREIHLQMAARYRELSAAPDRDADDR